MRVLLTTDTIGGVWTFTRELSKELVCLGHYVALVSLGRQPSTEQQAWADSLDPRAFRFHALATPLEWMQDNERAYTEAEPELLQIAGDFAPDIFHASQFCFGALPLTIPKLITAHSDVLSWAAACRPQGLEPSPWLDRYRTLVQTGLDAADAVIAPTRWMLEALRSNFTLPASVHVILNGRTLPDNPDEPRRHQAVSAGRLWDEAKNLKLLTQLDSPIPIHLAGERTGQSALTEAELLALFRQSTMYIAASIYEPFGLAPLEAALCGSAVIANDIPSLREVWGDAALYFINTETLINLLHLQPQAVAEAQARSQTRARQLTAPRMVAQYAALYKELLTSHPRTRDLAYA